jgi:hypothetical protein
VFDPYGAIAGNVVQIVVAQLGKYGRCDGPNVLPVSRYLIPFHWYDPEGGSSHDEYQSTEKIFAILGIGNDLSMNLSGL